MEPFSTLNCLTLSSQPELALLCNDVLSRLNFQNRICNSGADAADELQRRNFDLVIVDGASNQLVWNGAGTVGTSTASRMPTILNIVDTLPSPDECSTKSGVHYVERPIRFDRLAAAVKSVRDLVIRERRSLDRRGTLTEATITAEDGRAITATVVDISEASAGLTLTKPFPAHHYVD